MALSRDLTRGNRARRIRWLSSFVAVLVAITCGSASAGASVVDRDRSTRSYDEVRWDCGYPMQVVGVESHKVQVRANKKLDGFVFVTDNYDVTEVWTAKDGRSFTLAANGIAKDVKSKRVQGSVYEFTFHNSGQTLVITDSSGAVVYRDRGNISGAPAVSVGELIMITMLIPGRSSTAAISAGAQGRSGTARRAAAQRRAASLTAPSTGTGFGGGGTARHAARPGSGGHRPPRVSMAIEMSASGLWNP